jgi:hypothetical protein
MKFGGRGDAPAAPAAAPDKPAAGLQPHAPAPGAPQTPVSELEAQQSYMRMKAQQRQAALALQQVSWA